MSQATPFSGLLEMPDTGPPASDTDVQSVETGEDEPQSSGFKAFWQNHQLMMMMIGLGVLLLTAVLVFRKSNKASSNATNNTTSSGIPTVNTSDTAMAITQQNNSIEALLNAFQNFVSGLQNTGNTGSTSTDTGASVPQNVVYGQFGQPIMSNGFPIGAHRPFTSVTPTGNLVWNMSSMKPVTLTSPPTQ